MDLILSWNNINGRPTSAVADIDDAVTKRHTHANKALLDKVGEDENTLYFVCTVFIYVAVY